jgi:hypothetical protein
MASGKPSQSVSASEWGSLVDYSGGKDFPSILFTCSSLSGLRVCVCVCVCVCVEGRKIL